jgi:YHS domain-containing protein
MRRLLLVAAAMILAAWAAQATSDGAKPADAQKTGQAVQKDAKGKAALTDYKPQPSEYGKKVRCPVEGDEFKVGPDTKAVKYKGKTYYFCCGGCLPRFKKNPAKYVK